jgi:hypothetical protein
MVLLLVFENFKYYSVMKKKKSTLVNISFNGDGFSKCSEFLNNQSPMKGYVGKFVVVGHTF